MEHQLVLASLALALIVTVGAFLIPAVRRVGRSASEGAPRGWRPAEIAALGLPFLGFLLTLPNHAPFAGGQGLGRGFLIGGLATLALAGAARRTRTTVAGGAVLALPTAAVALTLLLLRPVLLDAIFGVGIGAFAVTFLLLVARRDDPSDAAKATADALLAGLGATVALSAAAVLGTLRDARTPEIPRGTWATAALAFAAGGALFALIAQAVRGAAATSGEKSAGSGIAMATSIAALGLSGVLAALLGTKFVANKSLIAVSLIGLALYPLISWLLHAQASGQTAGDAPASAPRLRLMQPFGRSALFLGVLLIACASMVGETLMLGYGFALATVALFVSWAVTTADAAPPIASVNRTALRLLLFAVALVLYRAFLARWSDDLRGVDLSDRYALFGFVVGAAAPHLVASLVAGVRRGTVAGARPLYSATVVALLTLAIPGAVVLIFGAKCALALTIGAAISGVFAPGVLPILAAIGMALALGQWNGHLLPYADVARPVKLKALAVVFTLAIVAVAVAAGTGRDETVDDLDTDGDVL